MSTTYKFDRELPKAIHKARSPALINLPSSSVGSLSAAPSLATHQGNCAPVCDVSSMSKLLPSVETSNSALIASLF